MSVTRADVVQQFEHSPTNSDHTHDFSRAYQSIVQMQRDDGGASSPRFHADMAAINRELHRQGLLPSCDVVGVDAQNHIITRDRRNGIVEAQDAGHVSDAPASASSKEVELQMLAKAFGISMSRNPDGSFNVTDPFANPEATAAGIMKTVFNGLLGGGSNDRPSDLPSLPGLNPLMAKAWTGWGSNADQPTDAPW